MTGPNLDRRMDRIEKRIPVGVRPCESCGAPVVPMRWVATEYMGPLPRCPECGRTLDYCGTPLAPGALHIVLDVAGVPPLLPGLRRRASAGDARAIAPARIVSPCKTRGLHAPMP